MISLGKYSDFIVLSTVYIQRNLIHFYNQKIQFNFDMIAFSVQ